MSFEKVNYSIICRTENGIKYGIQTRQNVSGYVSDEYPDIGIRQAGGYWYIDHIPTGLKISTFGCKSRKAALESYTRDYIERVNDIKENKKDFLKKAIESFQAAPLDNEVSSWETVNYCTVYNHRFDKVTDAARRAGLLIRKADNNTYMDGGNINIIGSPEALKPIKAIIEGYAKRDEQKAAEDAPESAKRPEIISAGNPAPEQAPETQEAPAAQVEPEKAPETVILIEKTYDIRNGRQGTRRIVYNPETGTTEAAQEAPQDAADVQPEPEARHRIQAPEKPACGAGKPLDFIGQVLSGNGWQIVFDTDLQRTRVIIEKSTREKAAPLAESAGFYYSTNTDSWHKKLTHKAHRAAVALAEKLRAACA